MSIDSENLGIIKALSLRVIAYTLRKCVDEPSFSSVQDDGIEAITFDKICLLLYRVWKDLHKENDTLPKLSFIVRPGLHGHGLAVPYREKPDDKHDYRFIIDYVEKLTERYSLPNTPIDRFCLPFYVREHKSIGKIIHPAVGGYEIDSWINQDGADKIYIQKKDASLIDLYVKALAPFNRRQVIAFGRHWTADFTVQAVVHLLKSWKKHLALLFNKFNSEDRNLPEEQIIASNAIARAREMERKLGEDRRHYAFAFSSIKKRQKELFNVGDSLMRVQDPDYEIWDCKEVCRYCLSAYICHSISVYVCHCLGAQLYDRPIPEDELKMFERKERCVFELQKLLVFSLKHNPKHWLLRADIDEYLAADWKSDIPLVIPSIDSVVDKDMAFHEWKNRLLDLFQYFSKNCLSRIPQD